MGEDIDEFKFDDNTDQEPDDDDSDEEKPPPTPFVNRRSKSRARSHLVRQGILPKLPHTKGKYKKVYQRREEAAARDRMGKWEPDMYKMLDGSALVCLGEYFDRPFLSRYVDLV